MATRRDLLWRSRVALTRTLVDWMGQQATPPRVLLSGSAVGWYGDGGEQWLAEDSAPGNADFGSRLCVAWEQEAERARQWGVRVALPRTARQSSKPLARLKTIQRPSGLQLGARNSGWSP